MRYLLALLLAVTPALALEQIGHNDTGTDQIGTANAYGSIVGSNTTDSAEADQQCLVSSAIVVDELCVEYGTAVEAGKTRKATFRDNGSSDTSIEVVHTAGESAEECDTGSITVSAGETAGVLFSCATICTASSNTTARWRVRWHTANDKDSIYCGGQINRSMSNGGTLYYWINGFNDQVETSDFNTRMITGGTCTVKNLYAKISNQPGLGQTRAVTLLNDGSGTGTPTCSFTGGCTAPCSCNDTDPAHAFQTTAGHLISLKDVASSTAAASTGSFGFTMTCDRRGEYVIATSNRDSLNNATTEYGQIAGAHYSFSTTEADHNQPTFARYRARKLFGELSGAAGGFGSFILTARKAGADTDLTITLTDATTVYSDTSTGIWPAAADDMTMKTAPSGGPSGSPIVHHSILVRDIKYRRRW